MLFVWVDMTARLMGYSACWGHGWSRGQSAPALRQLKWGRGGLKDFVTKKQTRQENKKNYQIKTTYMKCRTKTQARETTKTRKHIQQNTHKKHQKNKKQTQTKSWKNTRVPLELAKSEPDDSVSSWKTRYVGASMGLTCMEHQGVVQAGWL